MEDKERSIAIWCTLGISFFYTRIGVNKYLKALNVKIMNLMKQKMLSEFFNGWHVFMDILVIIG
jgi:hypothetical protein